MAVYATGDIYGNPTRLSKDNFYEQKDFSGNKDKNIKYDVSSFEELIANARNKSIDDFLEKLYKIGEHRDFDWEDMYELAEQLKAGVTND